MFVERIRIGVVATVLAVLWLLQGGMPKALADDSAFLRWNTVPSREECPVGESAVWVEFDGGSSCTRYFVGGDITDAPLVVVRFNGDHTSYVRRDPETVPDNTVRDQERLAADLAAQFQLPVIVIARPGMYGSSGNHLHRRSIEEFLALNAALDAIRSEYHFQQVVLTGQSGGATAAAALLTFGRRDIRCAVMTSGPYGLLERADLLRDQQGFPRRPGIDVTGVVPYDPLAHVSGITSDPDRKIVVIGNSEDVISPFYLQQRFANALAEAGHDVSLLEWPALPPQYHLLAEPPGVSYLRACGNVDV